MSQHMSAEAPHTHTHTHTHRKGETSGNLLIMRTRKMAKGTMARTAKINASRI